jgi:DNA mismatch repair protein MutS
MTQLLKTWKHFKDKYSDKIVFIRVGDFYEVFGDDARTCSDVIGLTVTHRKIDKDKPMAGVPYYSIDCYIAVQRNNCIDLTPAPHGSPVRFRHGALILI